MPAASLWATITFLAKVKVSRALAACLPCAKPPSRVALCCRQGLARCRDAWCCHWLVGAPWEQAQLSLGLPPSPPPRDGSEAAGRIQAFGLHWGEIKKNGGEGVAAKREEETGT